MKQWLLSASCLSLLVACGGDDPSTEENPVGAPVGSVGNSSGSLAERLNAGTRAILPAKQERNWVFDAYATPARPGVAWSRFWTKSIDLTGVAWDKPQTLTMISPRHAVMARHYQRPPNKQTVMFHDRSGREVPRLIVARKMLANDIAVVLLNEDVPRGVKHYPVLAPDPNYGETLPGTLVMITDRERKVHVHQVRFATEAAVGFAVAENLDAGFYEPLIAGDSGNPSFIMVRGQPVLIETHTTGGRGTGPFYGGAINQETINAAMRELSAEQGAPTYQLKTVRP